MSIETERAAYTAAAEAVKADYRERLERDLTELREPLEAAVVEAYKAGTSIAAICRAYGTSARVTITDILTKHDVYVKGAYRGNIR